ncbi:MAG TPA: electron transport complex subunit RsxD [Buchnera sp. (in: enterobacteria)]|nr:electron transport complex subunit RsxD [Buchnera sp. (in: enterobacteria)]
MINFPEIYYQRNTRQIMLLVLLACIPGISVQFYYFGYGTFLQILVSIVTALISESIVLIIRKKKIKNTITDNSVIVTAMLLAISVPPFLPWYLNVIGTCFSVIIAKQLYGGLGQNLFNPAMIGYVFLLISYPIPMTNFIIPYDNFLNSPSLMKTISIIFCKNENYNKNFLGLHLLNNNITQATPLNKFKTDIHFKNKYTYDKDKKFLFMSGNNFFNKNFSWQWINIAFFLGGVFLLWMKVICWRIPLFFLLMLTITSSLGWLYYEVHFASPLIHLFSGATMLGAFFIATDPVTVPTTKRGRIIFGILTGFLVWIIRSCGGYPDAVAFSILLSNSTVPLLDYYTRPKVYGYDKE